MRGPRVRAGEDSLPLELSSGSADVPASTAGTESGGVSPLIAGVEADGRFRLGRLRGRTVSPST